MVMPSPSSTCTSTPASARSFEGSPCSHFVLRYPRLGGCGGGGDGNGGEGGGCRGGGAGGREGSGEGGAGKGGGKWDRPNDGSWKCYSCGDMHPSGYDKCPYPDKEQQNQQILTRPPWGGDGGTGGREAVGVWMNSKGQVQQPGGVKMAAQWSEKPQGNWGQKGDDGGSGSPNQAGGWQQNRGGGGGWAGWTQILRRVRRCAVHRRVGRRAVHTPPRGALHE